MAKVKAHRQQQSEQEQTWIEKECEGVDLGDARRVRRFKKVVAACASKPQASLMESAGNWAAAAGVYRWLESDFETKEILKGHQRCTWERMAAHRVVLAVQDTTTLNHTHHKGTQGLGPIGALDTKNKGYFCHTTLAISLEGEALGILDAQTYTREEQPAKRKRGPMAAEAESGRWIESLAAANQAQAHAPQTQVISVADRECDFYEFLAAAHQSPGGPLDVLVRAKHDRDLREAGSLMELIAAAPCAGEVQVEVPRSKDRAARTATLELRFCEFELSAPAHWNKAARDASPTLTLWMVEAREVNAPESAKDEPILWRLLTSIPVNSLAQARTILGYYVLRWKIEVFFRILKSGCKVEDHALGTFDKLERILRVDLLVAWRVYYLMTQARAHPNVPADVVLQTEQWQALCCFIKKDPLPPSSPPTLAKALLEIAKLGGFPARKSDGQPGPTVVWRGLRRLDDITLAYLAFRPSTCV